MNKLSPQAIFDFMKVYYEVMGIIIPYEQAEEKANRFMRILVLTFPSDKIRTMKTLARRQFSAQRRGKKRKLQA
ncbi:hypothetical protein HGA91_03635 [candidate division WWE3 bacterium]|nr:hypothetical protein [candidate division WWE3 bacterium]